jgi:hypothetical protein
LSSRNGGDQDEPMLVTGQGRDPVRRDDDGIQAEETP